MGNDVLSRSVGRSLRQFDTWDRLADYSFTGVPTDRPERLVGLTSCPGQLVRTTSDTEQVRILNVVHAVVGEHFANYKKVKICAATLRCRYAISVEAEVVEEEKEQSVE